LQRQRSWGGSNLLSLCSFGPNLSFEGLHLLEQKTNAGHSKPMTVEGLCGQQPSFRATWEEVAQSLVKKKSQPPALGSGQIGES
jgi:hypothetical protein